MSEEEKYSREKFLDKKNWINKSGFIVSVGKYTMKSNNFIPNYVHATPSEPPLNHKFREIDKNKWWGVMKVELNSMVKNIIAIDPQKLKKPWFSGMDGRKLSKSSPAYLLKK